MGTERALPSVVVLVEEDDDVDVALGWLVSVLDAAAPAADAAAASCASSLAFLKITCKRHGVIARNVNSFLGNLPGSIRSAYGSSYRSANHYQGEDG